AMFKNRAAPKGARRKRDEELEEEEKDEGGTKELEKLAEVRLIQRECWKKPRGVPPAPEEMKQKVEEEEEEDDTQWGLQSIDSNFSHSNAVKGADHHMDAYINEKLFSKKAEAEVKEKTREERLYEVPAELK
ncbi:unnamed protein product, partial [Polarella glacialis]